MHIFTYGSLMFPEVWTTVVHGNYERQPARLYGYQRCCIKGETYPAAIAAGLEDYIDGQLYLNVDAEDQQRLDRFEGEDYEKATAPLILAEGGIVMAQLYLYRHHQRLEMREWDQAWFEREGIKQFLAEYGGFER
jgi:gamma-glutamylcyclotransferase (GGCT)/AIG2-like uncharacterized protein YtfP